jgi:hypothetical protein
MKELPKLAVNLDAIRSNPKLREEYIKRRWLNLPDLIGQEVNNPMASISDEDVENPSRFLLKIITDIRYVYFTAKYIFNITLSPLQVCIIQELWNHPFPMIIGSRGMAKTFTLAFYSMLKAFLCQGTKIVLTGAGFRQSKLLFEYCEVIWGQADILRDICGPKGMRGMKSGPTRGIDKCEMVICESILTALPIGNGEKIRGIRAHVIIADEFDAIDTEIFETVLRGFTLVNKNPIENMQKRARLKAMKELGYIDDDNTKEAENLFKSKHNQIIISGTASWYFRPFAKYWKKYCAIIRSRGKQSKLDEFLEGEAQNMENLDWRDYCVFRIPVELISDGYFEDKMVTAAKATMHQSAYQMELGAVFVGDSDGFFKRSLVESCVTKNPIQIGSSSVQFAANISGNQKRSYVYGIDPASERDNFALVILERWDTHRRVVYTWTTTRKKFKEKVKHGIVGGHEFYAYCARKIRDLMKVFPCDRIVMDAEGGGRSVMEALSDLDKLQDGEQPIWPIIDPEDQQDTDNFAGLHILELINFSDGKWVSEANHGMKKDFEDKALLFPRFDAVEIQLAGEDDNKWELDNGRPREDTLEDCVLEIEELKEELATIQHSQTPNGRERWDTPEVQVPGQKKKGRLRKDRYSALLLANMTARTLQRTPKKEEFISHGGVVTTVTKLEAEKARGEPAYRGPHWFTEKLKGGGGLGMSIIR